VLLISSARSLGSPLAIITSPTGRMAAQSPIVGSNLSSRADKSKLGTDRDDDSLLASLGYKQGLSSLLPARSTHDKRQHLQSSNAISRL
jgi:hypothetical protein